MIDPEGWENFVISFFGVDEHWLDHIVLNWNPLKNESSCGCHLKYGELEWCDGYKLIVEIRRTQAKLDDLQQTGNDEPLGENIELY